jgi:uncharacterized membrane protein YgcG
MLNWNAQPKTEQKRLLVISRDYQWAYLGYLVLLVPRGIDGASHAPTPTAHHYRHARGGRQVAGKHGRGFGGGDGGNGGGGDNGQSEDADGEFHGRWPLFEFELTEEASSVH